MAAATLYDYMRILYRRRWMVGLTVASAVAVAVGLSLLLPRIYESIGEFYVVSDAESGGVLSSGPSRASLLAMPLVMQELEKWYLGLLQSEAVRQIVSQAVKDKDPAALRRDVDVEFTRNHIVRVRARDRDPKLAAAVANAYPEALAEFLSKIGNERRKQNLEAMEKSIQDAGEALAQAEQQLKKLLAEKRSPSVTGEVARLQDRKAALESEMAAANAQVDGIEKRIALATEQLNAEAKRSSTLQGNLFSASVQRQLTGIADLEAELAAARAEYDGILGERHPKVRTLMAKIALRQQALARELEDMQRADVREPGTLHEQLRRDLVGLYKDRAAIRAENATRAINLDKLVTRVDSLQSPALREQEIRSEIERFSREREAMRQRQRDTMAQAAAESSLVVTLAAAREADEAKFPLPVFNALMAAFLGLIAGVYVAFAYDYLARARTNER
jgi:uncharacterized protein involved in exopolysaccharide biosynthesis